MSEVFGKTPVTSSQFPLLLWDAGGTLLHFTPTLDRFVEDQLRLRGHNVNSDLINAAWVSFLHELNQRVEHEAGFTPASDYWLKELLTKLKFSSEQIKDWLPGMMDAFQSSVRLVLANSVIELCERLRKRGYTLGIVSNWDHRLPEILRLQGVLDLFDVVITASEFRKPQPELFLEALQDLDFEASQALYIGESFAIDVVGAQRAGMKAILYDPTYRELKALAENTSEAFAKVVSIEFLRQNRRLNGVKVVTKLEELNEFFL